MNSSGNHPQEQRDHQAFTLTDLLVVIAGVAVLATVALAGQGLGSSEHVLRAQCASNLRQIGQALNVYAAESDDSLPICGMNGQQPWYTYQVARVFPGTTNLTLGFMNIGQLFRSGATQDARTLYCPAQVNSPWTYDHYASGGNPWPSVPAGSNEYIIRAGYNYYPQLRATEFVARGLILPKLTTESISLEYGSGIFMAPVRLSEVNPQKSITTDLIHSVGSLPHTAYGSATGLNVLFPDGNVVFQNARVKPEIFSPQLWSDIGNSQFNFRRVMAFWEP